MLASFTLGTLLFAGTALADMTSKSGYEQLKDSLKLTAEKVSGEFDSLTMDLTYVIKDNGEILQSENQVYKYDRKLNATETMITNEGLSGNSSNYYYSDNQVDIRRGLETNDKYYVTEFTEAREFQRFTNPFEEDEAEDIERIADAVVGSLKDHVIVKDNPEGDKELTGSLTEMQIPTLVNAVSSFQLKQVFNQRPEMNSKWPHLTQDIFVKEVTGSALINKDGVLENILGTATITGTDSQGQAHDITIEVLGKLKDVNSTTVTKPDLTGKDVVKQQAGKPMGPEMTNPQKFVGTFKNDILIEKDGKFAKAGERILEITQIDQNGFAGSYHEVVKPGFEDSVNKSEDFTFSGTFSNPGARDGRFEITFGQGGKGEGNIFFNEFEGKVNFHLNKSNMGGMMFDSMFSPVLE